VRRSRFRPVHQSVAIAAATVVVTISLVGGAQADKVSVKDVKQAFNEAEAASEQVNQLSVQIKQTKQEMSDLTGDINRQMVTYDQQKEALSSAIVQQHMDAPLGPTVSLLGSGDPEEFLDGLGAVQALNSTRADQLEKFGKVAKELKNRRAQLADRKTSLIRDKQDVSKERKKIRAKYTKAKSELGQLSDAEQAAFTTSDTTLNFDIGASGRAKKAVSFASAQLGDPYVYGGTGPNAWDCSGLVQAAWRAAGVSLPRVVGPQYAATKHISRSQLQPGDLVFYSSMAHVGMYIGKGKVIHAPHPGRSVEITGLGGFSKFGRVG
jgi:cell wall-associated NlpC family hydrolase